MTVSIGNVTSYHQIRYYSNTGTLLDIFDEFESLEYSRRVGQPGWCVVVIPGDSINWADLHQRDGRIEIRRRIEGREWYTEMSTMWLARRFRQISRRGAISYEVAGPSAFDLLNRRIVAYNAGSSQAAKSDLVDDMMKEIVSQNLGSTASDTTRRLSASHFSIAADTGDGPTLAKAFSRRNVGVVLSELSAASDQEGTVIYPDIEWTGSLFQFKTYPNQRGGNKGEGSANLQIFAEEFDNLTDVRLTYDYSNEVTYVYAGGQGEESSRTIQTASDSDRIAASPFNRIEGFVDARHCTTTGQLQAEAKAALWAGRPVITLEGQIQQTPVSRYGVEWQLGDKVVARFQDTTFDAWIDMVSVSIRGGQENINARILSVSNG